MAEDKLKERFDLLFESLGGEFFLGNEIAMSSEFSQITRELSFVISAV